jgi:hypothetical protein
VDREHPDLGREHVRAQPFDPLHPGLRDQQREQQGAEPAALVAVDDGDRESGDLGLAGDPHAADHLLLETTQIGS